MKNIKLLLLCMATIFMVSCEDEVEEFTGPYRLAIIGSGGAEPGEVKEYSLQRLENSDSYTWTVEGPATIQGSASGTSIIVSYESVGDVIITVNNGSNSSGRKDITVAKVPPAVSSDFGTDNHGVLRSGESDTVFFEFDSPFIETPTMALNTAEDSSAYNGGDPFLSGSLGPFSETADGKYYAIYTAGDGNGTPEALFQDIKTSETYGGDNIDSAFVKLFRVDNIVPVADLTYSHKRVNDSTVVMVTATFTEKVTFDFQQNVVDSAMYISFSGAGVAPERDTLDATDNPLVYTYTYTVNGEGPPPLSADVITVTLENVVDLAGHPLSAVNNENHLVVDNTAPDVIGEATDRADGTATITLRSNENGIGWYMILADGAAAPEDIEGFSDAVEWKLDARTTKSTTRILAAGAYDVWFIGVDEAGNYAAPSKVDLTVTN